MALSWPAKDPDAVLDYKLDWADWLGGDTITSSTWTLDPVGITIDQQSFDNTSSTIWFSGGIDGTDYKATNRIVTAAGRTDDRTVTIKVYQR